MLDIHTNTGIEIGNFQAICLSNESNGNGETKSKSNLETVIRLWKNYDTIQSIWQNWYYGKICHLQRYFTQA